MNKIQGRIFRALFLTVALLGVSAPSFAYHFPWDQGHDTTDWNDGQPPGPCEGDQCDPCKSTGSPVYVPTGHFIWTESDIALAGRPSLKISRTYNSHDPRTGIFGKGWSSSCDPSLTKVVDADGTVSYVLRKASGKRHEYKATGAGKFKSNGQRNSVAVVGSMRRLTDTAGNYREFNSAGLLVKSVDASGVGISYSYDAQGRIQKISSDARSISLVYNTSGFVSSIRDHSGRTWSYDYDVSGNLVSVTDPLGGVRTFEYIEYQDSSDGFTYQQLTKITDESGRVVTEVVYSGNKVTSYTEGSDQYTYTYDTANKITTKRNRDYKQWRFKYNDDQVITEKTDPSGNTEYYSYNSDGKLISFTDKLNQTWQSSYDEQGRKVSTTLPSSRQSQMVYSGDSPKPIKLISPSGAESKVEYDDELRPVAVTDAKGRRSVLVYDEKGNVLKSQSPTGLTNTFTYNSMGLLLTATDPLGNVASFSYDSLGRMTSQTDAEGRTTQYEYDALDRPVKTTNALGQVSYSEYDAVGRPLSFTDPAGNVTSWQYDIYGRLDKEIRPDLRETAYNYNQASVLTQIDRFDGKTESFGYDANYRMTSHSVAGDTINVNYNARGDVTSVNNTVGTISYLYDADGRVTGESQLGLGLTYAYDQNGARSSLAFMGEDYQYHRDVTGSITSLETSAGTFEFAYDGNGVVYQTALPNGLSEHYTFDAAYNLTRIATGNDALDYQRDKTGLITQKSVNGESVNYAYDQITRLTQAGSQTYNYDAAGNNLNGGAQYDADTHQLLDNNSFTFEYDESGNLTKQTSADGTEVKEFTYNRRNQLTNYNVYQNTINVQAFSFKYDALGRRYEKTEDGITKRYLYDGSDIVAILDDTNSVVSTLVHSSSIDTPLSITTNGDTYYYHRDHQGSIIALTDASGTTVESYEYTPYGETRKTASVETGNPYGFTGREYDADDLYYYRARYYAPSLQRFITQDPIELAAGDYNFYRYVMNDPVNQTDSSGMILDTIVDLGFILYDLYRLVKDNVINDCDNLGENLAALGADVGGLLVPFATGGGAAVRSAKYAKKLNIYCCFSPGTLVHSVDGLKAIDELREGDLVLSKSEETGEIDWKKVTEIIVDKHRPSYKIKFDFENGKQQEVLVTPEHPFWVVSSGWLEVSDIKIGMEVLTHSGTLGKVVEIVSDKQLSTTYNLEVEDFHTYFIGVEGIWVHNSCLPSVKKAVNSNLGHATERAVERGIYPDAKSAAEGLKNLTNDISKNGFPRGTIPDTAHADRVLVPVGSNGLAVYQVGKNGTAKLKTTLNRR
jgi:RHS repeat-associated protein